MGSYHEDLQLVNQGPLHLPLALGAQCFPVIMGGYDIQGRA